MAVISGGSNDDGRDNVADSPATADPELEIPVLNKDAGKQGSTTAPPAAPPPLPLPLPADSQQAVIVDPSDPQRTVTNRRLVKPTTAANQRPVKPTTATNRHPVKSASTRKPPISPTSATAAGRSTVRLLGCKKMSIASGSQSPLSRGSEAPSESLQLSASPQPESDNDSRPIEIGDDDDMEVEEEDGVEAGSKRKLTSAVWLEFKRVKFNGTVRAKCIYCFKQLSATSTNGTKHLHVHLKGCVQRKIKINGKKMAQASLRFGKTDAGTVSVENYIFDQDVARRELSAMIVLHEYPLSMVDHVGFRRFVGALLPLFKMGTRNTIRSDIMAQYEVERKKAIEYMAGIESRVAITTDLWTSDNQKRGYMAITAHFIDESWTLRNIIMRFIYVPTPHTADVIGEELYESMVAWNLDEKISAVTLDNCSTNDALMRRTNSLLPFGLVSKISKRACRSLLFKIGVPDSRNQELTGD